MKGYTPEEGLRETFDPVRVTPPKATTDISNKSPTDGLLFKIIENNVGEMDTVLCIPTSKVHVLLKMYHSSVIGGHVGITKCYQMISQRFYYPNLAEQLRMYITGCHVCQLFKKGKKFDRPLKKRVKYKCACHDKNKYGHKTYAH